MNIFYCAHSIYFTDLVLCIITTWNCKAYFTTKVGVTEMSELESSEPTNGVQEEKNHKNGSVSIR